MKVKILLLLGLLVVTTSNYAQKIISDRNSEDYQEALEMIGVREFKFDFSKMDKDHKIKVFIDEWKQDSVIQHKEYVFNPSRLKKEFENVLKVFVYTQSDTSNHLKLRLSHPSMRASFPIVMNSGNTIPHFWMNAKEGDVEYDKKIPLLLYGSAWEDEYNGQKFHRFCWGENLKRDMSNKELKKVLHRLVIGYELLK